MDRPIISENLSKLEKAIFITLEISKDIKKKKEFYMEER